jgi:hypothetical protein
LSSVTLATGLFIWITSPSAACIVAVAFVALPLFTTRPVTPALSRITRPVPVCTIEPRLFSVASSPLTVTATVAPPIVRTPVAVTVPVCPLALPSVCAVVLGPAIVKPAGHADVALAPSAKATATARRFNRGRCATGPIRRAVGDGAVVRGFTMCSDGNWLRPRASRVGAFGKTGPRYGSLVTTV